MSFKGKYHNDVERSAKYAARELEAKAILLRNLSKLGIVVEDASEYVSRVGIIDGHPSMRFDFILSMNHKPLMYVEVTGDMERDDYIYILSEKVEKCGEVSEPVFFLYRKERKRKWLVISCKSVRKFGTLIKWLEGEKLYYRVSTQKAVNIKQFVRWIKKQFLPYLLYSSQFRKGG